MDDELALYKRAFLLVTENDPYCPPEHGPCSEEKDCVECVRGWALKAAQK